MGSITVHHDSGDRFRVAVRDHELITDQPRRAGGDDAGPTPTELFVAGLAACVAFFARRFMARHGLDEDGLQVQADYAMSEGRPARVSSIRIRVRTAEPIPPERQTAFQRVLEGCTVHNSLHQPPSVDLIVEVPVAAASGG